MKKHVISIVLLLFFEVFSLSANVAPQFRRDCEGNCCVNISTGMLSLCSQQDKQCDYECAFACYDGISFTTIYCGTETFWVHGCAYDGALQVGNVDVCWDVNMPSCDYLSNGCSNPCDAYDCVMKHIANQCE